jgi:hypothetical protein
MRLNPPLLLAAALALACTDAADKAAKARVFSPEEPAEELLRAREPIAVDRLAQDPAVLARVVAMDRMEATRRLGAHRAVTTVRFTTRRGARAVSLSERHELATDASGQFRAVSTNDQDTGLEVVYAGGRAYVKSRYGPFRTRRMDRSEHDAWRNRATPALGTLAALAAGRLTVSAPEAVRGARAAHRLKLGLGEARGGPAADKSLPPPQYGTHKATGDERPRPGPDPDTALRLAFAEKRHVTSLEGELVVDDATGVVLASKGKVQLSVPGEGEAAALELEYAFEATPDAAVTVEAPSEVAPARISHAITAPLWFLDGGAAPAKAAAEEEPAGEAGDDEPEAAAAPEPPRKPAQR